MPYSGPAKLVRDKIPDIIRENGETLEEVVQKMEEKAEKRGGFREGIILDIIVHEPRKHKNTHYWS